MTSMMNYLFTFLLLLGLAIPKVHAAPGDNLGRLFSRPLERNNLDAVSYTHLDVYKRQA